MALSGLFNAGRKGVLLCILLSSAAFAQLRWWGDYEVEALKGGRDSGYDLNGVPNQHIQFNISHFDLFLEADLTSHVWLTTDLANNPQDSPDFNRVSFNLAYVTVSNIFGNAFSISAGKILSPFGSFAKRQLPPDNPFIGYPLFFTYLQNISPETGYLDVNEAASNSQYGGQLNTIYTEAYYTGAEVFGSFMDDFLDYGIAAMNSPLSSQASDFNVNDNLSFEGRIAVHPAIWSRLGISCATGPFMSPSDANQYFITNYGSLNGYTQTTLGADIRLSYLYYELNGEFIYNRFKAPYMVPAAGYSYFTSGLPPGTSLNLDSRELLLDLKVDAWFFPGLYFAFRYDPLAFGSITDPDRTSPTFGQSIPWSSNATRYEIAVGYKPVHGLIVKLDYDKTDVAAAPKPQLDVIGLALVASF